MPANFDKCAANPKSKLKTITGPNNKYGIEAGEYRHICFIKENGKITTFEMGEVKKTKEK